MRKMETSIHVLCCTMAVLLQVLLRIILCYGLFYKNKFKNLENLVTVPSLFLDIINTFKISSVSHINYKQFEFVELLV